MKIRTWIIIMLIASLIFALYMLCDARNDGISLSRMDSYEEVGGYNLLTHKQWTLADAFSMDLFVALTFNMIPLMLIILLPIWILMESVEYFEKEDR